VTAKAIAPAIEGWFTTGAAPALLGTRCTSCGTYAFPRETYCCANPSCDSREFDQIELSRRRTVWSFTTNCYQPPPPYIPTTDPFEPFAIAAVELHDEQLVVLGQVVSGVSSDHLHVGDEVELVLETLYHDDDTDYVVWKWRPIESTEEPSR
jgi:uncharacterized OB-fold protein